MRSRDDQDFFVSQEFVVQQLWQRAEWDSLIENMLQFDVAAGHGIADNNQVRARFEILGVERLCDRNVQAAEEVGHRRVRGGVGTRDAESAVFQHAGERGHGRAADADQVNVFGLSHAFEGLLLYGKTTTGAEALSLSNAERGP